jgi:hypothetical protein
LRNTERNKNSRFPPRSDILIACLRSIVENDPWIT